MAGTTGKGHTLSTYLVALLGDDDGKNIWQGTGKKLKILDPFT